MTAAIWRRPSILLAFFAASTSGLAILLYAVRLMTLTYAVWILAPLTALLFIALLAAAGLNPEDQMVDRLRGGLIAGFIGLVAYDIVRLLILMAGVPFNPFRPIEVYGLLILDRYEDTPLTKSVGWAFHIWNGLSFAAMYTLAVGRGRVLWGLLWGLTLEVAMLSSYPSIFQLSVNRPFVIVSLTGHFCYGLAIGIAARRTVRS